MPRWPGAPAGRLFWLAGLSTNGDTLPGLLASGFAWRRRFRLPLAAPVGLAKAGVKASAGGGAWMVAGSCLALEAGLGHLRRLCHMAPGGVFRAGGSCPCNLRPACL